MYRLYSNEIGLIFLSDEMNNYALSIDDRSGDKSYIRFNSRPGETVTLSNVRIDSGTMQELKEAVRNNSISMHASLLCFFLSKHALGVYSFKSYCRE